MNDSLFSVSAPLVKIGVITPELNLILAGFIGLAFGFILERAGFGSAHRMVLQFFAKDWSVFRVMFTAILTTMFGIIILDQLGIMPIYLLYINPTYITPQIIGGLIMGVGFVLGGYCPGTSLVALSSGKIDALFYVLGMVAGIVIFAESWDLIEGLYNSGFMGTITLPEYFNSSHWLIAFIVLGLAIVGFIAANYFENKLK